MAIHENNGGLYKNVVRNPAAIGKPADQSAKEIAQAVPSRSMDTECTLTHPVGWKQGRRHQMRENLSGIRIILCIGQICLQAESALALVP